MKTSRFILAAGFLLALALTLSCSDDDGGSTAWCNHQDYFDGDGIAHCSESKHKEECEEFGGTFVDSCPGGSKLKCNDDGQTVYLYTDRFKDCKEFLDWLD